MTPGIGNEFRDYQAGVPAPSLFEHNGFSQRQMEFDAAFLETRRRHRAAKLGGVFREIDEPVSKWRP